MLKKFASSLGLILLLNLLVKPFYILGIDAEVQNRVGQEVYGTYFALLNLSFIFNILIDFGINNFNNRNIAQNEHLIGKHFSKLFSTKALLALAYAAVTLLLGLALGYGQKDFFMLAVLVFNQVIVSFILFVRSNLAALHLFKSDSVISVLDRGLLVLFCSVLLFTQVSGGAFDIIWFVYLQTLAYLITLLISIAMVGKRIGKMRWELDLLFSRSILRKSLPYALLILSMAMYNRVDSIMLDNMLDDGSYRAGIYAQGYRFYEAASMFAFLFAVILLPMFSKMLHRNENIHELLRQASRLLLSIGLFASIFCYYFGGWILKWRYDTVTAEAVASFSALMFGFFGVCIVYVFGTLMTANENLKVLNKISLGGLVINVAINLALIHYYGAFGAAMATMITQLFAAFFQVYFVLKHFKFKFLQVFAFTDLLMVLLFAISIAGFVSVSGISWYSVFASMCLGVLLLVVSQYQNISKILRKQEF